MGSTYIIGDVHGHYERVLDLLKHHIDDVQGLIDENNQWIGGDATLCFVGDYFDRGPDGISIIDLIMALQPQAEAAGGAVHALLGNHDVFILAAHRFRHRPHGDGGHFYMDWLMYGGQQRDLDRMTDVHAKWLINRPCIINLDNHLVMHADAMFYVNYGTNIDSINASIRDVLKGNSIKDWSRLSDDFIERFTFYPRSLFGGNTNGIQRARMMLQTLGGRKIIHGHTPIPVLTGQQASYVTEPLVYANDLCVDVDGGIYQGGPGFVYRLPD